MVDLKNLEDVQEILRQSGSMLQILDDQQEEIGSLIELTESLRKENLQLEAELEEQLEEQLELNETLTDQNSRLQEQIDLLKKQIEQLKKL